MVKQFDLTQTFNLKGDWFLPEDANQRLSGELSYSPEDGIHLELIGDFQVNPLGLGMNSYPTILGIVEGSREISLFGCMYVGRGEVSLVKGNEIAKPVITFTVNSMVDGWLFGSFEEVRATDVYFEIDGLSEWLCTTGFRPDDVKIDNTAKTADVHYELPRPIEFEFPKGVKASFVFSMNNMPDSIVMTKLTLEQTVRLRLQKEEGFTLEDIFRDSYKFMTFLMLGLNGETHIKSVYFFNPDYSIEISPGTQHKRRVNFFYHQHFTVKERKWDFRTMTFTFPVVRDNLQALIAKWDEDFEEFEPAINLLIEQIRDKNTFNDNDFLNLAQAAETIHDRMRPGAVKMPDVEYKSLKKQILNCIPESFKQFVQGLLQYGNSVSLSQRLRELVGWCPQPILKMFVPDSDLFIKEIIDSRNYYTHYTLSGKKHVKRGRELMILTERIQVLLIVNLLLHLGIEEKLLVRLYENHDYQLKQLLEG